MDHSRRHRALELREDEIREHPQLVLIHALSPPFNDAIQPRAHDAPSAAIFGGPSAERAFGPEVARVFVLAIGDWCRRAVGDRRDRFDQTIDVRRRCRQARACPHRAGHLAPVTAQDRFAVRVDLIVGEIEQSQEVRVCAETSVPDADAVLGAQACRDERMVHAIDGEGRDRQRLRRQVRAEQSDAGNRRERGSKAIRHLGVVFLDLWPIRCGRTRRSRRAARSRRARWVSRLLRVRVDRSRRPRRDRRDRRHHLRPGRGHRRRTRAGARRAHRPRTARTSCGRSTRRSRPPRAAIGGVRAARHPRRRECRARARQATMSSIGGHPSGDVRRARDRQQLRSWCRRPARR